MPVSLDKVLATLLMIGSNLPAFKALFEQVISTFSEQDQATLKLEYAKAIAAADEAHAAAQSLD